ncbi:MAG: ABC transporter ATP-binding protein [Candidatus Aenigmarchaeota archaeon]|nr:ABC transporter ATP-binding protein [Candidatus Aenigmarchaeota archaeon]
MGAIVDLKNVSKIYDVGDSKVYALDDVSLKIDEGDFLMILGTSGSGKSTMMHMVGCLDLPTKGKILLEGKDISGMSESRLANIRGKSIGFVFQTFNLIQTMTVLENIQLPLLFQGVPPEEREKRAREIAEVVGLSHRLNHRPNSISGGERQRVAVARALVSDPKIIIADEPTGNLDTKTGRKIMDKLREINQLGKTVIVVTHDVDLTCYATRVIFLRDGKIVSEGGPCSNPLLTEKNYLKAAKSPARAEKKPVSKLKATSSGRAKRR